jgi:hypothetical protein
MGLIGGIARTAVIAGTATAVSNRVSRYQAGRWAAEDQAQPQPGYLPVGRYQRPPGRYQWPMFQPPPPQYQQPPVYGQPVYGQPQSPPAPAPEATTPEPAADEMSARLAQLQQLGELKAQGVLTDEEFAAQKSKILAG